MIETARAPLVTRPTPEQIEGFSKLSYEERFYWLVDILALWHQLSTPEVRRRWR